MAKKNDSKDVSVSDKDSSWPDLDRVFNDFRKDFEKAFASFPSMQIPDIHQSLSCDLVDEGNQFVAKADLPGVKKNDIKLNVTENSIEISADHSEEEEDKKKNFVRKERTQYSFYRTLPLPDKVNPSKVKAKYSDGILSVTLPKQNPAPVSKKKSISIQ